MINFEEFTLDSDVEKYYKLLLKNKDNFVFLQINGKLFALTKERSLIPVANKTNFLNCAKNDVYYHTQLIPKAEYKDEDIKLFFKYINDYLPFFIKKYANKYIFGTIAVKTSNRNIITTIRGKQDMSDFSVVTKVDEQSHTVYAYKNKATLNAPLLYNIFKNENVKSVVHLHNYTNNSFPSLEYAFPGTVKDSQREIKQSFNIEYHGTFLLFDSNGK